jgi:hypothetical protein
MKSSSTTKVVYMVQAAIATQNSVEWDPWFDLPDHRPSTDEYDAVGKVELFHYVMEHGEYPEQYQQDVIRKYGEVFMQAMMDAYSAVIESQRRDGHKMRTRVVKRTIVSTDEEIDKPMLVKYGKAKT